MPSKTYTIIDNWSRPFQVRVEGKVVSIFRRTSAHSAPVDKYDEKPCVTFEAELVFVGKSRLTSMTKASSSHGPGYDGHTMLFRRSEQEYIHVSGSIGRFCPYSVIAHYSSPLGANEVPYSYAEDVAGNTYLFREEVVLATAAWKGKHDDPYDCYYADEKQARPFAFERLSLSSIAVLNPKDALRDGVWR